jgi:hypothetical protein
VAAQLTDARFRIDSVDARAPYPFEHATDRLYVMARAG